MKTRHILMASAFALLAACGQADQPGAAAGDPAVEAAVELQAPAGVYGLDNNHASLTWSIPHLGLSNYTARFTRFDATVTLDPENLEASSVSLTIDPASVRTDFPGDYPGTHPGSEFRTWDEDIALNPNFLHGREFPQITFNSTRVEQTGPRTARVTGDLAFRGATRPVTLDATFNGELPTHPATSTPAIGFSAEGTFQPSEFGVNLFGGALGDAATIRFEGEFLQHAAAEAQ